MEKRIMGEKGYYAVGCHDQEGCFYKCVGCVAVQLLKEEKVLLKWWEKEQETG